MAETVIRVENISKRYRLGAINHGTLCQDLQSWWHRMRRMEDPNSKIGDSGHVSNKPFWALDDVSFEVEKGEVFGIIGRNGAGKSTLLKILSRVTAPTRGQIKIRGQMASLLEVGTGFHPELTGMENIFLNGAILGMKKAEIKSKCDEIIDFSGIGDFIDTPVKRYSSGMYVRLAFSVAAHLDSDILVIDEVLAVGDIKFSEKCAEKIRTVRQSNRTAILVSHNPATISELCQRTLLLDGGRIEKLGPSAEVVAHYKSPEFSGTV